MRSTPTCCKLHDEILVSVGVLAQDLLLISPQYPLFPSHSSSSPLHIVVFLGSLGGMCETSLLYSSALLKFRIPPPRSSTQGSLALVRA